MECGYEQFPDIAPVTHQIIREQRTIAGPSRLLRITW